MLDGLRRGERLGGHTSLKVGGPADAFALAGTVEEVVAALRWAHAEGLPARVMGGGSNLLVSDAGVEGLVVKATGARAEVVLREDVPVLVADAGVTLANVARRVSRQGFGGLEWATNVPGTVGGAAVNNAGAFGGETAACLIAVTLVDASGDIQRVGKEALDYAYRTSRLKRREMGDVAVVQVELRLAESTAEVSGALVKRYTAERTRSQPRILSAGSVFANPPGDYAGRLIEAAGLKGAAVGGAQISTQHANFIVNPGGATADDVYRLMRLAQQTVHDRFGVWLRSEIELFGRWTDEQRAALGTPTTTSGAARA